MAGATEIETPNLQDGPLQCRLDKSKDQIDRLLKENAEMEKGGRFLGDRKKEER